MIVETATQKRLKKELDKQQKGFRYATDAEMYKDYKFLRGQVRKNLNQLIRAERGQLKGRYESLNGETSPALRTFREKTNSYIDMNLDPEIMDEKSLKRHFLAFARFLTAETGTLKNWANYRKKTKARLEELTRVEDLDEKEFFKVWERIKDLELHLRAKTLFNLGSEEIMEFIAPKVRDGYSSDEIIKAFKSYLKDLGDIQMKMEEEGLNDPFNI